MLTKEVLSSSVPNLIYRETIYLDYSYNLALSNFISIKRYKLLNKIQQLDLSLY